MPKQHTAEIFDMRDFLAAESIPVDPTTGRPQIQHVLPKQAKTIWRVRTEPVVLSKPDNPKHWTLVRMGDLVRIPLIPYRTSRDSSRAMLAGMDIIQRCVEANPNAIRTHIIVGDPIQDLEDEGEDFLRIWIGFAAQLG